VQFDLLAEYNPAPPEDRTTTRKPARRLPDSEGVPRSASRSTHPLPLHGAGQGRPPYSGPVQPKNPGRASPVPPNPGIANPGPTTSSPGVPPRPTYPPSGGPQ
jgi:hypothetical protein